MPERNTHRKDGGLNPYPVAAGVIIEAGNIVALGAGYARHAADTAGYIVVGMATETVDNSGGGNGDKTVNVERKKAFKLNNSGSNALAQANVGGSAYVEDSTTVCTDAGATNNVDAGEILAVDSDGVWVLKH